MSVVHLQYYFIGLLGQKSVKGNLFVKENKAFM